MQNWLETIEESNDLQNKVVYHIISKALMLATKDQLSDYISDIPIKSTELASHMGYHPQAAQRLFNLLETLNLLEIVDEEFIIATELTPCIHQIYSEHFFGSFAALQLLIISKVLLKAMLNVGRRLMARLFMNT